MAGKPEDQTSSSEIVPVGRYLTLVPMFVGVALLFSAKRIGLAWPAWCGFGLVVVGSIWNMFYQKRPNTRLFSALSSTGLGIAGLGHSFARPAVLATGLVLWGLLGLLDIWNDRRHENGI